MRCKPILISLCLLAGAANAQREARVSSDELGAVITASGSLKYMEKHAAPTLTEPTWTTLATGVATPGDMDGFVSGSVDHVLVSGLDSTGKGVIQHFKRTGAGTGTFSLQSTLTDASKDYTGICYDAQGGKLYALDAPSLTIRSVAWSPTSAIPTTGWAAYATIADSLDLLNAVERLITFVDGKVVLARPTYLMGPAPTIHFSGAAGSLTVTTENIPVPRIVARDADTVFEGTTSIVVKGVSGQAFEVVHSSSGLVIGSGSIPASPASSVSVALTQALILGDLYVVRKVGEVNTEVFDFVCVRRYGFGETMSDGTSIARIAYPGVYGLGNTLRLRTRLSTADPVTADKHYTGFLAIAIGDPAPGGPADPVVPFGANTLLNTPAFLTVEGAILDGDTSGFASERLDIPDDPALVGTVHLFQFIMNDPDGVNVRLSDIIGIKLTVPPLAAKAGGGGGARTGGFLTDPRVITDRTKILRIMRTRLKK